jgi:uncharacterized protein YukJ
MPLRNYGVPKGKAILGKRPGAGRTPHYQVQVLAGVDHFRIAINVLSQTSPPDLLFILNEDFKHPVTNGLTELSDGLTTVPCQPGGHALDFVRGNLFKRAAMKTLPPFRQGPDNDLVDRIDSHIQRAIDDHEASIFAFGEHWGPGDSSQAYPDTGPDRYFGFTPQRGIHDIHMNQGNAGRFRKDDGVYQDGGILIHFPALAAADGQPGWPEHWVAFFAAFQSQSWHTDNKDGHAPLSPEVAHQEDRVQIVAALVNPQGTDTGNETVTLLNTTPTPIDLTGWTIADSHNQTSAAPSGPLAAGATTVVALDGKGAQLGNHGGIISLLDDKGTKVDGVKYTGDEAQRQGYQVTFRD